MDSMTYHSILVEVAEHDLTAEVLNPPEFFADLNLDQIIDAVTAGKAEYNLKPIFYCPCKDLETIRYRHATMRELESKVLLEHITSFAKQNRLMREHLAQAKKLGHKYQKGRWFLDAVEIYCDTINSLVDDLSHVSMQSRGLALFRDYLIAYTASDRFKALQTETGKLKADLATVKYCVLIKGGAFRVRKYQSEIDYSENVEEAFAKFKQGAVKTHLAKFSDWSTMNHIEEKILDFVARLYPEIFQEFDRYIAQNGNYLDATIGAFDREIQFFISYLEYIERFKRAGLKFSYPIVSDTDKEIYDYEGFDLALANTLMGQKEPIVCNDFYLKDKERIFVVSGPNQGGKTTFARAFGQLHYLASLGCPVPGRDAQLFFFDKLFTHFEKEEHMANLRGKLEDELVRINGILNQATPRSILIMNEIFTSTTLSDAIFLSTRVIRKVIEQDMLCVCVTFVEEIASFGETTVSVASTVVPENPASRTFKIVRKPADGLAYAISIAEKHHLTYDCLKERIQS
jgi:DNA mismatch repair protein MutS